MKQVKTASKKNTRNFAEWNNIAESVADAFKMDNEERECFRNKNLAQLVAAIP